MIIMMIIIINNKNNNNNDNNRFYYKHTHWKMEAGLSYSSLYPINAVLRKMLSQLSIVADRKIMALPDRESCTAKSKNPTNSGFMK